ncbi:MAG: hypothetical protein ACRDJJ_02455 [Actinomycetota bacterium]
MCVRHQESAPLGIIEDVISRAAIPWRYADVWSRNDMPDVSEGSGLIVLGGEMNADDLDGFSFLRRVRNLVREAVEGEVPVLGVCLGARSSRARWGPR